MPYAALEDFISSAARILSQGGRVLRTTPNPCYRLLRRGGGSVLGGAYVRVHCPAARTKLLNYRGSRVARGEEVGRVSRAVEVRFALVTYGSFVLIAERRLSDSQVDVGLCTYQPEAVTLLKAARLSHRWSQLQQLAEMLRVPQPYYRAQNPLLDPRRARGGSHSLRRGPDDARSRRLSLFREAR